MIRFALFFVFLLCRIVFIHADLTVQAKEHPFPVIIDTDCDLDDMMTIIFLVKNPRVEVKGITTVGSGISHWEYGVQNVLNVLELIGHPRVPVALGSRESLSFAGSYPPNRREQSDRLLGIHLPQSSYRPLSERGAEFIIDTVSNSQDKVILACIGPLTNIALAFSKKPEIKEKIKHIYVMGGALLSPGNLVGKPFGFTNRTAEYNIFLDAKAAQEVFDVEVPITLVPIDISEEVPYKPFYDMLVNNRNTPAANFIYEILKPSLKNKKRSYQSLWDPVTAALITNPDIATYRDVKITINLRKGPEYGRLLMGSKGNTIRVVTQIHANAFYRLLLETVNRDPNLHSSHVKMH